MEIKYGKQIQLNCISNDIDLFLLAGNHEKRFLTSFNKISKQNKICRTIALCYNSTLGLSLPKTIAKNIINNTNEIFSLLDLELAGKVGEFTLFIDYSCMTKPWYYSIILYLSQKKLDLDCLRVFFSYTPSKYSPPQVPKPNTEIIPLPGKYIVPTNKPKALIVCLGYEQQKAEGIIEHLDPKLSYIFYTKPALDNRFVKSLEASNDSILSDPSKIIRTYRFDDLLGLERQLTAIYETIKNDYSIIFAPLGPKPFTFISMLMSVKYPDIDVWRVGSGNDINEYEREPIKDDLFIITEILFAN